MFHVALRKVQPLIIQRLQYVHVASNGSEICSTRSRQSNTPHNTKQPLHFFSTPAQKMCCPAEPPEISVAGHVALLAKHRRTNNCSLLCSQGCSSNRQLHSSTAAVAAAQKTQQHTAYGLPVRRMAVQNHMLRCLFTAAPAARNAHMIMLTGHRLSSARCCHTLLRSSSAAAAAANLQPVISCMTTHCSCSAAGSSFGLCTCRQQLPPANQQLSSC